MTQNNLSNQNSSESVVDSTKKIQSLVNLLISLLEVDKQVKTDVSNNLTTQNKNKSQNSLKVNNNNLDDQNNEDIKIKSDFSTNVKVAIKEQENPQNIESITENNMHKNMDNNSIVNSEFKDINEDITIPTKKEESLTNYTEITLTKNQQSSTYESNFPPAEKEIISNSFKSNINIDNKFLQGELEELKGILVDLELSIYNYQELINILLPAVAETIQDKIKQREGAIANIFKLGESKTINEQIENETQVLIEAIYPVIGATISGYIGATISKMNSKVVDALHNKEMGSNETKLQAISLNDLKAKESNYFKVEMVFLIHKQSNLVIAEKKGLSNKNLTAEFITSVLSSIRNLSHKFYHHNQSNFLVFNHGENQIVLYAGISAYLAVIAKGNPPKIFLEKLADTLTFLEKNYETCIKLFQGDRTTIPESIEQPLQKLLDFEVNSDKKRRNSFLLRLSLAALFLIGIPLGIYQYFNYQTQQIEKKVLAKISADSELGVYNLEVDIKDQKTNLTGKLPNDLLKEKAGKIVKETIADLPLNNKIVVVDLPPNEFEIKQEIDQIVKVFNQIEGIKIKAIFEDGILNLTGEALELTEVEKINNSFAQIKGINEVNNNIKIQPISIPTRVYFSQNSTEIAARDIESKLISIKEQMQKYPQLKLKIIGYKSNYERWNLGLKRAQVIATILEDLGIDRRRLEVIDGKKSPPDIKTNQESWLSQCVVFEINNK